MSSTAAPSYVLIAVANSDRATAFADVVAEALGSEPVIVRDGDAALNEVEERGAPKVLLIDPSLPRIDGFTVIQKLRRHDTDDRTQVIVLSAHPAIRAAARELAPALGVRAILPLDVDRGSLTSIMRIAWESALEPLSAEPLWSADAETSGVSLDEIIERAAVDVRRRFHMAASIGYFRSDTEETLTLHVAASPPSDHMFLSDALDISVLRQVADDVEPFIVPDIEASPLFARTPPKSSPSVRGFVAVPVISIRRRVHGVLCVLDTKPLTLTAAEIDTLAAIAREVGDDIDRGRASSAAPTKVGATTADELKALQHLASTDPLTGLANRRGGERHIANEISRAKREKRPLSCILLDIDRFKQVNDTFGHQAGDQLLRDISALLRRTVRAYDILVRWGGEEFLVVLPGVDVDAARVLAERIRLAVESLDTHGIGPVTISAGAAAFESDYDFTTTLRLADRRLYQAKAAGRNCVV